MSEQIWQYIAHGAARSNDTSLIKAQPWATIQAINDQSDRLTSDLAQVKQDADTVLGAIRAVEAEHGGFSTSAVVEPVRAYQFFSFWNLPRSKKRLLAHAINMSLKMHFHTYCPS